MTPAPRHLAIALGALLLLPLAGCSDDSDPAAADGGTAVDAGPLTSQMQAVINKIKLPQKATDYAADLDGDGTKDNQIGLILEAFGSLASSFDSQDSVDKTISGGEMLVLLELFAPSATAAPKAELVVMVGSDPDSDPKNNFTGTAILAAQSGTGATLKGSIKSAKLSAGPGTVQLPLPVGSTPVVVSLKKTSVEATLTAKGMVDGVLRGAVAYGDVTGKLLPSLAAAMDKNYKDSTTSAAVKAMLQTFDGDSDGTITGTELQQNAVVGAVLKADVDSDGDGKVDAISVAAGFTAVVCNITK